MSKPYILFKRNGSPYYYIQVRLQNGKRSVPKSTGEKNKGRAENKAIELLSRGVVISSNVTFGDFAKGFFDWDGRWALDIRSKRKRLSQRQCRENTRSLQKNLIPVFGKIKLTSINKQIIEDFRNELFKSGYAGSSINKLLSILSQILAAAEDKGLINKMPRVDKVSSKSSFRRGTFTMDEIRQIFDAEWKDMRCFLANLISASTGLRLGEILALCREDINWQDKSIYIHRSYDYFSGKMNETTKTGEARWVYPLQKVFDILDVYLDTHNSDFIFPSSLSLERPMRNEAIRGSLYKILDRIGIDSNARQTRHLSFHSWRHTFNSLLLNNNIAATKVQALTGHMTVDMMNHYFHLSSKEMNDVSMVIEKTFTNNIKQIETGFTEQ